MSNTLLRFTSIKRILINNELQHEYYGNYNSMYIKLSLRLV
jgi:hypothetical protein